jgi:hypothetical protein
VSENLLAGKYYVKIEATVGHPQYTITSQIVPVGAGYLDSTDPNESAATAKPIDNCGSMSTNSTGPNELADDDWFSYNASAANNLVVNFGVVASMAPEVVIYDSAMNVLYDKTLPQWEDINFAFAAGKQYYILVRPVWTKGEGLINNVIQYTLSLY